jgi:pilus assembly protein CpaE
MQTVIACNDQSISLKICASLRQLGIECPLSKIVSQDCTQVLTPTNGDRSLLVVFFGSATFTLEELTLLKQLSTLGGERVKVVAVGPAANPNLILQAVRSGAVDYLDVNYNFDTELGNLLDRIKTADRDQAGVGRLFTVLGHVGGVGASLLATNLAAALAQKQEVCGLLDFQLRGGDLAMLLKSTPRHTLLSLADKAHQLDRAMFDRSLIKHESGIHLLAGPEPFSDYRQVSPQVIQKIVQFARASYPSVVVDLEDAEHPEQVRALAASDQIILPLRLDFVSLCRAKKCVDHLLRANVLREHITLVANRTGQPKELPVQRVSELLGLPIEHQIPDDPATVNSSFNLGEPLVIASPKSKVAQSIVRLAESLIGIEPDAVEPAPSLRRFFNFKSAACLLQLLPFVKHNI